MNTPETNQDDELDFVKLGNAMGYRNPMYLPQDLKDCIAAALRFIKADRSTTDLKARIDELKNLMNHLLGDLYDENDNSAADNAEIISKLSNRISTLAKTDHKEVR